MNEAPKILTVVIGDLYSAAMHAIHLNESVGVQRRTVQIRLTEEQREQLALAKVGHDMGHDRFEEITACWFEPTEETES